MWYLDKTLPTNVGQQLVRWVRLKSGCANGKITRVEVTELSVAGDAED